MTRIWKVTTFVIQSAVAGLAIAFIVILLRPNLLDEAPPATGISTFSAAVAVSSPAVANVFAETAATGRGALGSAVVIDPAGYLVTNWHVVRDAAQIRVQLADGRVAAPEMIGADPDTELALLRIDLPNLPSIELSRSDNLRVGDVVLAIGNSLGLSQTVTMGIVSATGRGQLGLTTFEDFIQTDAAINVGNSGGALINTEGQLVGINTAVIGPSARSQIPPAGIGFAIPVNLVRGVMEQLIEHGRVIRGDLGIIEMSELSAPAGQRLGLDGPAIQLLRIEEPALSAGLEAGDILTHVDDVRVYTRQNLMNLVASGTPGERIRIRGLRPDGGVLIDTEAVLVERGRVRPGS